jgi:hypothetical protein
MQQSIQIRDRTMTLVAHHGPVVHTEKRAETHVSGGGGQVNVHNGSGSATVAPVRSTIVTKHEFWIKPEHGPQITERLVDVDIPMAPGQRLTLLYGVPQQGGNGALVALVNHDAQKFWVIPSGVQALIQATTPPLRRSSMAILGALCLVGLQWPIFFAGAAGFGGWRALQRHLEKKRASERAQADLHGIAASQPRLAA